MNGEYGAPTPRQMHRLEAAERPRSRRAIIVVVALVVAAALVAAGAAGQRLAAQRRAAAVAAAQPAPDPVLVARSLAHQAGGLAASLADATGAADDDSAQVQAMVADLDRLSAAGHRLTTTSDREAQRQAGADLATSARSLAEAAQAEADEGAVVLREITAMAQGVDAPVSAADLQRYSAMEAMAEKEAEVAASNAADGQVIVSGMPK